MVMRWMMRGVCLVLRAGVVGVGVGSYAGWLRMRSWSAGQYWEVGAVQGLGYMGRCDSKGFLPTLLQFNFERGATAGIMPPRTLGFYGGRWLRELDSWLIVFPLWLPTVVLVVLNGFVWRWTRRRKVGRGFPVEAAKKAEA